MTANRIRNCSIDIFRYVCAAMVVIIHTHPFADFSERLDFLFSGILSRIAVPFFFTSAGYFYMQKLERGESPFWPYLKRLLIPYVLWTIIYDVAEWIQSDPESLKSFLSQSIYEFFVTGSYTQFWFFPALVFAICCTTLLFRLGLKKAVLPLSLLLYSIGCLGCAYHKVAVQLPLLQRLFAFSQFNLIRRVVLMGFPYFTCGYLVYKIQQRFPKLPNQKLFGLWLLSLAVWLAEILAVCAFGWQANIIITFGLYGLMVTTFLVLLYQPLPQRQTLAGACRVIANFTYYSHLFCKICLVYIAKHAFHTALPETPMFALTMILTFLGGVVIWKWNNRWIHSFVL